MGISYLTGLFNLKQLTELVPHFSLNKRMLTEIFQISLQLTCVYVFESAHLCVHVEMYACVHVQVKAKREIKTGHRLPQVG